MAKKKETMRQISEDDSRSEYYRRGLWRCHASPTGAHQWRIDGRGMGQCECCGERRLFAALSVTDYSDAAHIEWGHSTPLAEFMRDLASTA